MISWMKVNTVKELGRSCRPTQNGNAWAVNTGNRTRAVWRSLERPVEEGEADQISQEGSKWWSVRRSCHCDVKKTFEGDALVPENCRRAAELCETNVVGDRRR